MFSIPKGSVNGLEEGASPDNPIVLNGVKASDFRALLKLLYSGHFTTKRPKLEPEVIIPAFRLAHMWNFPDLRTHLFPLVKNALGCVDKIVLARELGIQEWLAPAHVELCQRTEPLTMEEVRKLGIDSTVMIFQLREKFHSSQSAGSGSGRFWNYCQSCGGNSPMYTNHGEANCHRCGKHMNSSKSYFRFPATTSSTTPSSGSVWNYCHGCAHIPSSFSEHGQADCHKCGTHIGSNTSYWRFTATPSNTALPYSNVELESQVKEWVEAGCATE